MQTVKFTLLGTGTSSGVPLIACNCDTCISTDIKDKRLRCSLLMESPKSTILVDTSLDFRQQMLLYQVKNIDAIIFTHHHFDHIGGFDDIRAFNFINNKPIDIYANQTTMKNLNRVYEYAFSTPEQMGGGVPMINPYIIHNDELVINDLVIQLIKMKHGKLDVLGLRVGDFAYLTDTNYIPDESLQKLMGLEVLVIDALRFDQHPTHFNVSQALEVIDVLKPHKSYLTHIAHQLKHKETENILPPNVFLSFDGINFELPL
ncbi:MBL fold metallo-hydrolase [Candidatus Kapaibacterium sp.]